MRSLNLAPGRKKAISTQKAILEKKLKRSIKLHLAKDGAEFNSDAEKSMWCFKIEP